MMFTKFFKSSVEKVSAEQKRKSLNQPLFLCQSSEILPKLYFCDMNLENFIESYFKSSLIMVYTKLYLCIISHSYV